MSNIDWSRPLEAYHKDGRVVDCQPINPDDPSTWPDNQGQYHIDVEGVPLFFEKDGTEWSVYSPKEGWRIRNKDEPKADIPDWAIDKVRAMTGLMEYDRGSNIAGVVNAFARYVANHEEPPVDPDLIEARKIAFEKVYSETAPEVLTGDYDGSGYVKAALVAIKRGRELERGEVK